MARDRRDLNELREAVSLFLAGLVGIVWAITTIAATFFNRPLDTAVHGIMLAVVTALLGGAAFAGRKANQRTPDGS